MADEYKHINLRVASRAEAWIETTNDAFWYFALWVASRAEAWIETLTTA